MRHVSNRLVWVPVVALSLLVFVSQAEVARGRQVEPVAPAPAQPQSTNCSIVVPGLGTLPDVDCDGFSLTLETHVGTLPLVACGSNAWPADIAPELTGGDKVSDITG